MIIRVRRKVTSRRNVELEAIFRIAMCGGDKVAGVHSSIRLERRHRALARVDFRQDAPHHVH